MTPWTSRDTTATIRTSPRGYQVWIGVGVALRAVGHAGSYDEAEALAVSAVRQHRLDAAGHDPDDLPIHVRRGPMTQAELGHTLEHGAVLGGSSWDLPVVATYRGGAVERHDERVTWSDDESRRLHREREAEGQRLRAAEAAHAVEVLASDPGLSHLVSGGRVARGPARRRGGASAELLGGCRLAIDGPELEARLPSGRTEWLPAWEFAGTVLAAELHQANFLLGGLRK